MISHFIAVKLRFHHVLESIEMEHFGEYSHVG